MRIVRFGQSGRVGEFHADAGFDAVHMSEGGLQAVERGRGVGACEHESNPGRATEAILPYAFS